MPPLAISIFERASSRWLDSSKSWTISAAPKFSANAGGAFRPWDRPEQAIASVPAPRAGRSAPEWRSSLSLNGLRSAPGSGWRPDSPFLLVKVLNFRQYEWPDASASVVS